MRVHVIRVDASLILYHKTQSALSMQPRTKPAERSVQQSTAFTLPGII